MTDDPGRGSGPDAGPEVVQSPARSDADPTPADSVEPDGAGGVDPGRDRTDPMGVVLRLPSRRVRGGTPAVTLEHPDPDAPPLDQEPRESADTTDSAFDATEWLSTGIASAGGFAEDDGPVDDAAIDRTDWAWVQEWRAGNEPTPWATGLVLTVFAALVVGVAVWVLAAGLSDRPVVAVLVNLLVAGGLAPAIWLSRGLPVLRWIGAGAAAGIVIGWIAAVLMLPLPTP